MADEPIKLEPEADGATDGAETPVKAPPPSTRPPRDRAVEAGFPPDSGPEQKVETYRIAMMRAAPLKFFGLAILLVGGAIAGTVIWFTKQDQTGWQILAGFLWFLAVVSLGVLAWWKILTYGSVLKITNKRAVAQRGIFSKATSEVLHDNIRNVKITQSFWQRVWNVGTIGISSAGQDDIEVEMADLPGPHEIARIIDLYRPLG